MLLEWAVWGVWSPIITGTLANRGWAPQEASAVFTALWLGCVFTPLLGGQIVDRWMPSQWFLALAHLAAAGCAWMASVQTQPAALFGWMLMWSLCFAPTLGVVNAIAMHHIGKEVQNKHTSERVFSMVRTGATVGWIGVAFLLHAWMRWTHADALGVTGPIPEMQLSAVLGLITAAFCPLLPGTPPSRSGEVDPLAFRRAFRLFHTVPGFATFMAVSFCFAGLHQFYYVLSAPYMEFLQVPHTQIAIIKSVGQVFEIAVLMVALPLLLPRLGLRRCLLLSAVTWPVRYVALMPQSDGPTLWIGLAMHGAFMTVLQQMYVARIAPYDIRGSAQNLLTFVTLGLGNTLGSLMCGVVQHLFTSASGTHWAWVWAAPATGTLILTWIWARLPDLSAGSQSGRTQS